MTSKQSAKDSKNFLSSCVCPQSEQRTVGGLTRVEQSGQGRVSGTQPKALEFVVRLLSKQKKKKKIGHENRSAMAQTGQTWWEMVGAHRHHLLTLKHYTPIVDLGTLHSFRLHQGLLRENAVLN